MYASKSNKGFFPSLDGYPNHDLSDAVEIPDQLYGELKDAVTNGKIIDWSGEIPAVIDAPARPLSSLREKCLAEISAERDRREELGFPYRGKWLDSTPRSVQRITAAALAAQAMLATGQPYSADWTCADNSTLSLDTAGVIGIPVALAQHAAALHDHARSLKAAIEAADNAEQLAAIDINAGWPGSSQP